MIEIKDMHTGYTREDTFLYPQLSFEEGKIVSVMGANGCGKSTLLKAVAGIIAYKGSIKIDGSESKNLLSKERARRVAYLPQVLRAVNIDVETLCTHGRFAWHGNMRRLSKKDREMIDKALQITEMVEFRHKNIRELSGGERQRAYLSMAIAQDAPMILLDEPTTFMDIAVQRRFFQIIRRLAAEGHGIVMVSHNIEQSLSCSDMVCLIEDRKVRAFDTPEKIIEKSNLMRDIFGTHFKKSDDKNLLYPYVAVREGSE